MIIYMHFIRQRRSYVFCWKKNSSQVQSCDSCRRQRAVIFFLRRFCLAANTFSSQSTRVNRHLPLEINKPLNVRAILAIFTDIGLGIVHNFCRIIDNVSLCFFFVSFLNIKNRNGTHSLNFAHYVFSNTRIYNIYECSSN